mgnify:CR=1 FL=1
MERKELGLRIKEYSSRIIQEIPTYARRLRDTIMHHPVESVLAAAAIVLGAHVFLTDEYMRAYALPRIGIGVVIGAALAVPAAIISARLTNIR